MKNVLSRLFSLYLVYCVAIHARVAFAADVDYIPLSGNLPIIGGRWIVGAGLTGPGGILNSLVGISVGLAAALAVIMLAIGGFRYMTSDSVFNLGSAKEQITDAIVGLLIVLSAVLVLGFINPDIISMKLF